MGGDFRLTPAHLHFGDVRVGGAATRAAHLLNLAPAAARFSVALPEAPVTVKACFCLPEFMHGQVCPAPANAWYEVQPQGCIVLMTWSSALLNREWRTA